MADCKPSFDELPQYVFELLQMVQRLSAKTDLIEKQLLQQHGGEVDNKPLNKDEAAAFLGISPKTIYQLTSSRTIKHMSKGNKLYFLKSDLLEYLESGRVKTKEQLTDLDSPVIRKRA